MIEFDLTDAFDLTEAFGYLDELRESGATNMFGAPAYLVEEYAISRPNAMAIVKLWMDTFDGSIPLTERVELAIGSQS